MKCILIPSHGEDIDKLLTLSTNFPKPVRKPGQVLVKVQACALAPGDIRVMKGHCDYWQSPRGFPYVPGGDLSGIVEEADKDSRFTKGDRVLCMFAIPRPLDGLGEYACVEQEKLIEKIPDTISFVDAAALTSSALAAYNAVESYIKKPGKRVLILGGSGGVGTFLLQMAKNAGASYIAATSTDEALVKSLGADCVINYKEENFWDIGKFKEEPFDIIIDLGVGRYEAWKRAKRVLKAGKDGGIYLTFSGDEPEMKIHNLWQTITFTFSILPRVVWTRLWPFVPRYSHHIDALEIREGVFNEIVDLVEQGKLRVVIDPYSTKSLELDAVKKAFHVMDKRASHGKVVVRVA